MAWITKFDIGEELLLFNWNGYTFGNCFDKDCKRRLFDSTLIGINWIRISGNNEDITIMDSSENRNVQPFIIVWSL